MNAKPGPMPRDFGYRPPRSKPSKGRPPIEVDPVEFEKLAALHCTQPDIAGWLGIHITTLEKKLASNDLYDTKYGKITLRELLEIGQGRGRVSVRRMQMSLLEKGNATMAIWLGKNLLGQSDEGPVRPEPPPDESDDIEIDG